MGLVLGCGISDEITLVILRELQQHLEILLSAWWISNGWGLHGHSLLWQQPGQSLQHHHASELDASIWYHCSSQHGRQLGIIFVPVGLVHNHALHRSHFPWILNCSLMHYLPLLEWNCKSSLMLLHLTCDRIWFLHPSGTCAEWWNGVWDVVDEDVWVPGAWETLVAV